MARLNVANSWVASLWVTGLLCLLGCGAGSPPLSGTSQSGVSAVINSPDAPPAASPATTDSERKTDGELEESAPGASPAPKTESKPAIEEAVVLVSQATQPRTKRDLPAPADALFSLQIGDLQSAWQKWQKSTYYDWSHSAAMQPFKQELLTKNVPSMMNPQAFLGFEEEKLALFPNQAVYFVVPTADEDVEVGFVVQTTDKESVRACLTSAGKHFAGRKWQGKELKVPGATQCTVYTGPKDKDGLLPQRVYFTTATTFGIASHPDVATKYAAGLKSDLGSSAEYQQVTADAQKFAGNATSDATWFMRPMAWVYHIKPKPAEPPRTLDKGGKPKAARKRDDMGVVLKRQGFDAMQAMASVVTLTGLNDEPEQAISVLAPAPYTKGMMLLEWIPGKMPSLPAWLPGNLASLTVVHADSKRGFAGFGHWFDEFNRSPGLFTDILDSMKRDPKGPKVDLREDLVKNLSSTVVLLTDYSGKPTTENPQGKRSVNYHTTDHGKAVLESLTKYYSADPHVTREVINGWTTWTAKPGMSLMIEGSDDRLPKVECISIKDGDLLMSSTSDWVKEIVRGGAAAGGLHGDAIFTAAQAQWKAWETDLTSMRSVTNSERSLARSYEGLRSNDASLDKTQETRMLRMMLAGDPEGTRGINYKLLPQFTETRKYILPSGTSVQTTKTGMRARMGYLVR